MDTGAEQHTQSAASRNVLYGLAPALAQACILRHVPNKVAQTLSACFPSADSVRHTSLRDYHLCLPLYMDTKMHVLERTLSKEYIELHQQSACEVLALYNAQAQCNASSGALIVSTRDTLLLSGWPLTDLCVVASILPFHLPPTTDQRDMLVRAREKHADMSLASSSSPSAHSAAPLELPSKPNTASSPQHKDASPTLDRWPSAHMPIIPNTKMTRWLCFEDPHVERRYDLWLGANNLRVQRLVHLTVGWPWSIFSGFTEPWHLVESNPVLWVVMIFALASLFYLFYIRPSLYRDHYGRVMLWGWFSTGWFFPLSGAHIPVQRLEVEELSKGPWFQSSIGCMTASVVPLIFMPKFVNFLPYQTLLLLAHTPATMVLASKLGIARTALKALAWQLCFSLGVVGAVVYIIDSKSRRTFIMSLEAAHARAMSANEASIGGSKSSTSSDGGKGEIVCGDDMTGHGGDFTSVADAQGSGGKKFD